MRLIAARTLELESFDNDANRPRYAILSHRWMDKHEITLGELISHSSKDKFGWKKILFCCQEALNDGIDYVWIDTCCIDKSSSAELTEAINSMYRWYRSAHVCYAYLNDVFKDSDLSFKESLWFTRSWTLQELLAPNNLRFYDASFTFMGTKHEKLAILKTITKVPQTVLRDPETMHEQPIAWRMSWAAARNATRAEDVAYSLFGIFDVNLPLLYGEGARAFTRLQEEIIRHSDDQSIFMWDSPGHGPCPVFAASPMDFSHDLSFIVRSGRHITSAHAKPYSLTNVGLQIDCCLVQLVYPIWLALFEQDDSTVIRGQYCMFLVRDADHLDVMYRVKLWNRATCSREEAIDLVEKHFLWPGTCDGDQEALLQPRWMKENLVKPPALCRHLNRTGSWGAEWKHIHIKMRPRGIQWEYLLHGLVLDIPSLCESDVDSEYRPFALVSNFDWDQPVNLDSGLHPPVSSIAVFNLSGKSQKVAAKFAQAEYVSSQSSLQSLPKMPFGTFAMYPLQHGPVGAIFFDPARLDLKAIILGFDTDFKVTAVLITARAPIDLIEIHRFASPFVALETFKSNFYLSTEFSWLDSDWLPKVLRHAFLGESCDDLPDEVYIVHESTEIDEYRIGFPSDWRLKVEKQRYKQDESQPEDHQSTNLMYLCCWLENLLPTGEPFLPSRGSRSPVSHFSERTADNENEGEDDNDTAADSESLTPNIEQLGSPDGKSDGESCESSQISRLSRKRRYWDYLTI